MSNPPVDPSNIPYRSTPEYAAACARADRDRARMRHRVGLIAFLSHRREVTFQKPVRRF